MKLKFKDVLPNPYRDLKGNPLLKEKIAELVASINTTGFWDNVVVRKNKAGKYELAYGHHRVAAAIKAGLTEADFIVKDLSDALMIQIMDNENREVYSSSPSSMIEAVKAVVSALAEGSIKLELSTFRKDLLRYAPSYVQKGMQHASTSSKEDPLKAYSPLAIAKFLGRTLSDGPDKQQAPRTIESALDFLSLQALGKINAAVLVKDGRPITAYELLKITTEIKKRYVATVVRREKSQAEINEEKAKQAEADRKAKEAEKIKEDARIAKRLADAAAKKDKEDKEKQEQAQLAKEALDNAEEEAKEAEEAAAAERVRVPARIKEIAEEEKRAKEKADYAATFSLVHSVIGTVNHIAEEHGAMWEKVSVLHRSNITPADRQRVWEAFKEAAVRCDRMGARLEVTLSGVGKKKEKK